MPSGDDPSPKLKGREIIVAVCGGIAAYKVADVVSTLVHQVEGLTVAPEELLFEPELVVRGSTAPASSPGQLW